MNANGARYPDVHHIERNRGNPSSPSIVRFQSATAKNVYARVATNKAKPTRKLLVLILVLYMVLRTARSSMPDCRDCLFLLEPIALPSPTSTVVCFISLGPLPRSQRSAWLRRELDFQGLPMRSTTDRTEAPSMIWPSVELERFGRRPHFRRCLEDVDYRPVPSTP